MTSCRRSSRGAIDGADKPDRFLPAAKATDHLETPPKAYDSHGHSNPDVLRRRPLDLHPEEYTQLSASFFIKVTRFFRDRALFDLPASEVVAEIVSRVRKQRNQIRIWSAGCATGEEAYSLAILISEHLAMS